MQLLLKCFGGANGSQEPVSLNKRSSELPHTSAGGSRVNDPSVGLSQRASQESTKSSLLSERKGSEPLIPNLVLGKVLGAGNFGRVYKGLWEGKLVAVKVVQHDITVQAKVLNEVNLMCSFKHKNVVTAYHYINRSSPMNRKPTNPSSELLTESSSNALNAEWRETWILQEYCDKGSLDTRVYEKRFVKDNVMDLHSILLRLRDVAEGLAYLHKLNVCHGDLKCDNVLLCTDKSDPFGIIAKLTDFGFARALNAGQTHASTCSSGSVTYMPPELLSKGKLTLSGDVYAFGVIMWEMSSGKKAFAGLHYGDIVERVVKNNERPEFPSYTPKDYVDLAVACWSVEPAQRPQMETVLSQLSSMLLRVDSLQAETVAHVNKFADYF